MMSDCPDIKYVHNILITSYKKVRGKEISNVF